MGVRYKGGIKMSVLNIIGAVIVGLVVLGLIGEWIYCFYKDGDWGGVIFVLGFIIVLSGFLLLCLS